MEPPTRKNPAQIGTQVKIALVHRSGEREVLAFDLVRDEWADYAAGFLGASTHLAKAILGESPGTLIPYFTDELQAIEMLTVTESTRKPDESTLEQRTANLKEARDQIDFRNAVLFAASTDTKWGSYDADGLDYEQWKSNPENRGSIDEQEKTTQDTK